MDEEMEKKLKKEQLEQQFRIAQLEKEIKKAKKGGFFKKFVIYSFVFFTILSISYAGYLVYLFNKMPGLKGEVSSLYNMVMSGSQAQYSSADSTEKNNTTLRISNRGITEQKSSTGRVKITKKKAANSGNMIKINAATSDATLNSLIVEEHVKLAEGYKNILDGGSLKLLKKITEMVTNNKNSAVISSEDEEDIKQMVEKILGKYDFNIN